MLNALRIQNFKGLADLSFPTLKRVNLITGKNNTCKTGVLEALYLLLAPQETTRLPSLFRNGQNIGDLSENYWKWLFHNRETTRPAVISTTSAVVGKYSIAATAEPHPLLHGFSRNFLLGAVAIHVSSNNPPVLPFGVTALSIQPSEPQKDALDYDRVVLKSGGEERLESLLRKIEPRLRTIRSIKPHGAPLLYVDIGLKDKIPAIHLGQGFLRLLGIYSEIITSQKKVLLIDEFENGLHYSVLTEIWRGILGAVEQENIQVFATTHSYECIKAAHAAFSETIAYEFALHRLESVKDEIKLTTFDKEALETALINNFEIR